MSENRKSSVDDEENFIRDHYSLKVDRNLVEKSRNAAKI